MFDWLKKILGPGAAVTATAATHAWTDQADPNDPFAIYIAAVRDLMGEDRDVIEMLELARDNPADYEKAQAPGVKVLFSDYIPGEEPIGSLFRDMLMERGQIVYLDWKDGPYEFVPLYDEQMARLGLAPLTSEQNAALEAIATTPPPGADRAYFPDYLLLLETDARAKGYRILVFDENADSYAFLVVTPDQFARWADVRLGPDHRFFSPASFGVDQLK